MNVAALTGTIYSRPRRFLGTDKKTVILYFDVSVPEVTEEWENQQATDVIPVKIAEKLVKPGSTVTPGAEMWLTGALQHGYFVNQEGKAVMAWGINANDIMAYSPKPEEAPA